MKNKLRKIVIDGEEYLWKIDFKYSELKQDQDPIEYEVRVRTTLFKSGKKNTPLIIDFIIDENPTISSSITTDGLEPNLHEPKNIRLLILEGLDKGWNPQKEKMHISNGLAILKKNGFSIASYDKRI